MQQCLVQERGGRKTGNESRNVSHLQSYSTSVFDRTRVAQGLNAKISSVLTVNNHKTIEMFSGVPRPNHLRSQVRKERFYQVIRTTGC